MKLKFNANNKFTVLQVSDPQDMQYVRKTMLYMLSKAYDRVKPDLVVLTGDNILGNHLCDARIGDRKVVNDKDGELYVMKKALNKLLSPIEERKLPFAMIYGNHDDRNRVSKDEQADIYRSYKYNVGLDNPDKSVDCDTYNIPIYSSDGEKVAFNIWMLDSAWYDKENDKCCEDVKPATVEWYKNKSRELKEQNGGKPISSLMFQHIPMRETKSLLEECCKSTPGAVEGEGGKFYKLKADVKGEMHEYPSMCENGNGQFEAMKECGDIKAVVFGHDHPNCFEGNVGGIDFVQTSCASFRCYGGRNRGVRVFTIDEKTGDYKTEFLTYADLCGKGPIQELRYIWDADGMGKTKAALILGTASVLSLAAGTLLYKRKK